MPISKKRNTIITKRVKRVLDDYIASLSTKVNIDNVFLFGSAARNEMKKDSDIDLLILSKDFSDIPYFERLKMLSRATWPVAKDAALDVFGYTPEEFDAMDKEDSQILKQIKKEGFFVDV